MRNSVSATSVTTPVKSQEESWLVRRGPLLLCLAASLPLLVPVLNPAVQLYYRDTLRLYYPVKKFIADQLAQGHLPLWDPRTESGTSLLGQMSPGLLHPLTLLYLLLPFDLAFKLNHLAALPLAASGAYVLARRLACDRPAAAVAGVVYGGCGYLVSMVASNLPYALGSATLPWAMAGVLWLCELPSTLRLLAAALPLALCVYAGEPQSAFFGGLLGGLLALLEVLARAREGEAAPTQRLLVRRAGLCAAWGALALLLCAPAALPGYFRLNHSTRWGGLSKAERQIFELHPGRLFGLLVPRAFDNLTVDGPANEAAPYEDYFVTSRNAFADSTGLGAPALLLALLAAVTTRRGLWLSAAALLFALGACGQSLGVYHLLFEPIPGMGLFRYTEKLAGPCSLLLALAAAVGAEEALGARRRSAGLLAGLSAGACALFFAARGALGAWQQPFEAWLLTVGRKHDPLAPAAFTALLGAGLATAGALSLVLALVALHRRFSERGPRLALLLAAGCCAASVLTYAADLLQTSSTDFLSTPPPLATELFRRGGRSEDRWRLLLDNSESMVFVVDDPDERFRVAASAVRLLRPQVDALYFESAQFYFSLGDADYSRALSNSTAQFSRLFGVRFIGTHSLPASSTAAKTANLELSLKELDPGPRAFLVDRVVAPPPGRAVGDVFGDQGFDARKLAVVKREEAAELGAAGLHFVADDAGSADYARGSPERISVKTRAGAARLAVVGEHFDPGWAATIDGTPAPLYAADGLALGIPVPAGEHEVLLRFRPRGLVPGLALALAALLALAAFHSWQRRRSFDVR